MKDSNFTRDEKIEYLTRKGFKIEPLTTRRWSQWGNHDSQGDWIDVTITCALRENEVPCDANELNKVFKAQLYFYEKERFLNS